MLYFIFILSMFISVFIFMSIYFTLYILSIFYFTKVGEIKSVYEDGTA